MTSGWAALLLLCLVTYGTPSWRILATDAPPQNSAVHPGTSSATSTSSQQTTETVPMATTDTVATSGTETDDLVTMTTTEDTSSETDDTETMVTTEATTATETEMEDAVTTTTTETHEKVTIATTNTAAAATVEATEAVTTEMSDAVMTSVATGRYMSTQARRGEQETCRARGDALEEILQDMLKNLPRTWHTTSLEGVPEFLGRTIQRISFVGLNTFRIGKSSTIFCKGNTTELNFNLLTSQRVSMSLRHHCCRGASGHSDVVIASRGARVRGVFDEGDFCLWSGTCPRIRGVQVVRAEDARVEIPGTTDEEKRVVEDLNSMFPKLVEKAWKKSLAQALEDQIYELLRLHA